MLYAKMLTKLDFSCLDTDTVQSISDVIVAAVKAGDMGIVDWAKRAVDDAAVLGRLRNKDRETLVRLKGVYGHDYYTRGSNARSGARLQAA